jgi:hypothetical protein
MRLFLLLCLALLIAVFAGGCLPAAGQTQGPLAVRVGYFPNVTHSPALIGMGAARSRPPGRDFYRRGVVTLPAYNLRLAGAGCVVLDGNDLRDVLPEETPVWEGANCQDGDSVALILYTRGWVLKTPAGKVTRSANREKYLANAQ